MDTVKQSLHKTSSGAQSVDRALALLSQVARDGDGTVSINDLVAQTGLSRPTVRRLLLALIRAGLVEQDAQSRDYALGPESYVLGLMAQRRFDLLDLAMDSLRTLSRESGDTSFLSVRRGSFSVCLHREDGPYPVRTQALQAGNRHPLGIGAGAMAILAALPQKEAEQAMTETVEIVARDHPNYSAGLLHAHIRETRARGWSLNPGLQLANSWAIGVALHLPDGGVLGALSIAAIDSRMQPDRQEELAIILKSEARGIETRLSRKFNLGGRKATRVY